MVQARVTNFGRRLLSSSTASTANSATANSTNGGQIMNQFSASLAVYFKVPDQRMTEYEILTRCTATPLQPTKPKGPHRFLVAAHTAQPWLPQFKQPWHAEFVNETHVRYYVEFREPSGTILAKHELLNKPNRHPTRDIAALQFLDEAQALEDIRSRGVPFSPLALRTTALGPGEPTDVVGFEVVDEREHEEKESRKQESTADDRDPNFEPRVDPNMVMRRFRGFIMVRSAHQVFLKVDAELKPGMCGGGVLDSNFKCCGFVEGIVPTPPPDMVVPDDRRLLSGAACMIESTDMITFLEDDDVFSF